MVMRPRKAKQTKNEGSMQVSEPKLSNAEKQKRYRERLQFRPDYLEIKKKNSEKAKMNRQKEKSETEMVKIREGNHIRARNYRERQKALGIDKKRPKPKTRQKISDQREY